MYNMVQLINHIHCVSMFTSSLSLAMKRIVIALIFLLSLGQVFSCIKKCLHVGNLITFCQNSRSPTNPAWSRIYQLDTKGDHAGCYGDQDGNKWCKFWADPDNCFRNGKGDQWCFNKVLPSGPYDKIN